MKKLDVNTKYNKIKSYLENHKILFKYQKMDQQFAEIWIELFNETISLSLSNNKIQMLKTGGFIFQYKKDAYSILEKYLLTNKIFFQVRTASEQIKEIWFELFNEVITSKQSSMKILRLRRRGFNLQYKMNAYSTLEDYILTNKIIFKVGESSSQIKEIWFKLFNEDLSPEQSAAKIKYLRKRGFSLQYRRDVSSVIKEYITKNKILFKYQKMDQQFAEIWIELFNETISLSLSNNKIQMLKTGGFIFQYKKDAYSILEKYLLTNKIFFQVRTASEQIKEIWFELFNEVITSKQSSMKILRLRRRGFNLQYKMNAYSTLEDYILTNKIIFKVGKSSRQIKEIWFKLFNEDLSPAQSTAKIHNLKRRGFSLQYRSDVYPVIKEYITKNKILFQYQKMDQLFTEIWFELFNETLSLRQSSYRINYLKKGGFTFHYKTNSNAILINYITTNKIFFSNRNLRKQIGKIWFELFSETLSFRQIKFKILQLKQRGFVLPYEKNLNKVLEEYLLNNKILFHHRNLRKQIEEIWFELFNKRLSTKDSNSKVQFLKYRHFNFQYSMSSSSKIVEHLKNNNLWIAESNDGYKSLQKIWEEFFQEKISLIKCKLLFIEISSLCPQCVYREIITGYVQYKNIHKVPDNIYQEHVNIFAIFCRNNNITLEKNIEEDKLSRIWSVCFAKDK